MVFPGVRWYFRQIFMYVQVRFRLLMTFGANWFEKSVRVVT